MRKYPHTQKKLEALIFGRKGGVTSAKIIKILFDRPFNINQISKELEMHYNTIVYQTTILEEKNIIQKKEKKYGSLIYLSDEMNACEEDFYKIFEKIK